MTRSRFRFNVGWFLWLCSVLATQAAGSKWSVLHQSAVGSSLWGVAAGPTSAVAVGTGGKILFSPDGEQWIEQNSGTTEWLTGVAYGASQFVAVGDHGTMLESSDGKTWVAIPGVPTSARLNNIAYANNRFVAVGESGTIVVSDPNGWRLVSSGVSGWLRGIARGRELWIATGQNGTVLVSPSALEWTPASTATSGDIEAVVYQETITSYEGGVGGLSAPPNRPPWFYVEDSFGVAGAGGLWMEGHSILLLNSLSTHFQVPSFMASGTALTSLRLRAATSVAGILLLAGDGGQVFQKQLGDYGAGKFTAESIGSSANFNSAVAFGDSIILVGSEETIARESGIYRSRLANVSTRVFVQPGEAAPIAGLVIDGDRNVLIRAIGPSLKDFGISQPLLHPVLTVYDHNGQEVHLYSQGISSSFVSGAVSKISAAYPFFNPDDAAVYLLLSAGAYTVRVTDAANASGIVLLEAFEDPDQGGPARFGTLQAATYEPRLINLSTRGLVGANENTLIGGFIVTGDTPREVLIRAAGPALAAFGIQNPATTPSLTLFRGDGTVIASNSGWSMDTTVLNKIVSAADIREANTITGAFPFKDGSHDAALLVTLPPGNYTAHLTDPQSKANIALLEIYEVKR